MASYSVLHTLIELVEKELEQAGQNLALANRALKDAEEKGNMLQDYRQDYVGNLSRLMEKGLTIEAHQNYQNFLNKLEQAIQGQKEIIVSTRYQVEKERAIWQEAQRKKLSYEVLMKQKQKKEHLLALKKDQKLMDEYAMRAKRNKQH
ncbi:MAG TPA: flagellar export protein FliJ [Methylophilus sp.]|nr:flagellar export protein FliJ [Methylophilus sp.]